MGRLANVLYRLVVYVLGDKVPHRLELLMELYIGRLVCGNVLGHRGPPWWQPCDPRGIPATLRGGGEAVGWLDGGAANT